MVTLGDAFGEPLKVFSTFGVQADVRVDGAKDGLWGALVEVRRPEFEGVAEGQILNGQAEPVDKLLLARRRDAIDRALQRLPPHIASTAHQLLILQPAQGGIDLAMRGRPQRVDRDFNILRQFIARHRLNTQKSQDNVLCRHGKPFINYSY